MAKESAKTEDGEKRTVKSLVNTPFKKAMLGVQLLSYVLIVGSPGIGLWLGNVLEMKPAVTILGIFIAGEILFYGSLFFLGKEVYLLLKERVISRFSRKRIDQ